MFKSNCILGFALAFSICYGRIGISAFVDDDGNTTSDPFVEISSAEHLFTDGLYVSEECVLALTGDGILRRVSVSDRAVFRMTGGAIVDPGDGDDGGALEVADFGRATITGGTIRTQESPTLILTEDSASLEIRGGVFDFRPNVVIQAKGASVIDIFGGVFTAKGQFSATDVSTINFHGFDLSITHGYLTGTLLDGSSLGHNVSQDRSARINLHNVPEPVELAVLHFALAFSLFLRRQLF